MKLHRLALCLTVVSSGLLLCAGCSSSGSVFRDPSRLVHDPGQLIGRPRFEKSVVRIVTLWEASTGKDPSDIPSRGFAGQILFFGPRSESGVRVCGKVVIYEYDNYDSESGEIPDPLHSFTFEPDAWDIHRTEGTLGHSYSCFIPYMNQHRDQAKCGLKVEFIGEDGRKVSSEIVEILLPSRSSAAHSATRGFIRESQLGGSPVFKRADEIPVPRQEKLDTLSIPFPKH